MIRNIFVFRFDMIHRIIGFSHELILHHPEILVQRRLDLRARHFFLKKLGRDQYDPQKPNYASPKMFCEEDDAVFCEVCARVPVEMYNKFLLTV